MITADEDELACQLLKLGVRQVVMTLGEAGCALYETSYKAEQAACSLNVVDTTGASDAFVGAYCLGLLDKWPAGQALEFANGYCWAGMYQARHHGIDAFVDRSTRAVEGASYVNGYDRGILVTVTAELGFSLCKSGLPDARNSRRSRTKRW